MKRYTVLVLIICLIGCTTLQPVPGKPAAVQQGIASGGLLKQGDHVVITTRDGRTRDFSVTSIGTSTIEGRHESISIDQILLVQRRKLSVEKTALAVGFVFVVAAVAVVVAVCSVGGHRPSAGRVSGRSARFAQPIPPPLLLPTAPQNGRPPRCDGPSVDGKSQEDGQESAQVRHCPR